MKGKDPPGAGTVHKRVASAVRRGGGGSGWVGFVFWTGDRDECPCTQWVASGWGRDNDWRDGGGLPDSAWLSLMLSPPVLTIWNGGYDYAQ